MPFEIRKCSVRDARRVSLFLEEMSEDFPTPLCEKVDIGVYVQKLISQGQVYIAESAGKPLGVIGGYVNNAMTRRAYVSVIVSSRAARRMGVGSALLAQFEECARAAGMVEADLETSAGNNRALAFYRKKSFRILRRTDSGDYRLRKRLAWLTPNRPNVLLSSVGRRTYLVRWFREALGGEGRICVTNSDPTTPAFVAADAAEVSPLIYSDEYIPFIIDFCERHHVGAVVPLFDVDIPILAMHRAELEASGVLPIVAPEAFARACSDKLETANILNEAGIAHPATYVNANDFVEAVARGEESFPAFVKPRWGMGSMGLAEASNETELNVLTGIARRKVSSSYLRYESASDPLRSVLVQPVIVGQEYGMDVINDLSGDFRGCVVRRKAAMRAGETDVAEVLPNDSRFDALARRLSELSRHPGNMDVDVFDNGKELVVLEMNARFGGGYPFSHAAGVNLPRALVAWLRGEECKSEDLEVKEPGLYMKDISMAKIRR